MDSLWQQIIELASKKVPNIVGIQESSGKMERTGGRRIEQSIIVDLLDGIYEQTGLDWTDASPLLC